ncbi:hypothetical protein PMAYCL1PPCAC_01334, partial [Pristionchus mayeri]
LFMLRLEGKRAPGGGATQSLARPLVALPQLSRIQPVALGRFRSRRHLSATVDEVVAETRPREDFRAVDRVGDLLVWFFAILGVGSLWLGDVIVVEQRNLVLLQGFVHTSDHLGILKNAGILCSPLPEYSIGSGLRS